MSKNPVIKLKKTYEVRFTKFELMHLRDLMSISLPPDGEQSISESLAKVENRTMVESSLWKKLTAACESVGLPTGDNAPDYIVAPTGMPPLGVFQLATEPPGESDEEEDEEEDDAEDLDGDKKNIFDLFKKIRK